MSDRIQLTEENLASYYLASAVHNIQDPTTGGPRGQIILWVDTWYPQAKREVERLRKAGDPGVLAHDEEVELYY